MAENEETRGNGSRHHILLPRSLTVTQLIKTMLPHRRAHCCGQVSQQFLRFWFISWKLISQMFSPFSKPGNCYSKGFLCELFSLASFISCFYQPLSLYFHIKFHLLHSDPVSQYIWHPFDFFLLPALHLQVRANVRSLQLVSLCGSFTRIRNTEGSTNSSSGFNQYFLRVWHESSLFLSNPLLCDTLTAWSLQVEQQPGKWHFSRLLQNPNSMSCQIPSPPSLLFYVCVYVLVTTEALERRIKLTEGRGRVNLNRALPDCNNWTASSKNI